MILFSLNNSNCGEHKKRKHRTKNTKEKQSTAVLESISAFFFRARGAWPEKINFIHEGTMLEKQCRFSKP